MDCLKGYQAELLGNDIEVLSVVNADHNSGQEHQIFIKRLMKTLLPDDLSCTQQKQIGELLLNYAHVLPLMLVTLATQILQHTMLRLQAALFIRIFGEHHHGIRKLLDEIEDKNIVLQ